MKHGKHTAAFGRDLKQLLEQKHPGLHLWYDHGDPEADSSVVKIQGFLGDRPSRLTNLTEVDVMISNAQEEPLFLIEIEETQSPPKKLLGDALALMMCNGFAVKRNDRHEVFRPTMNTRALIASWFNPKGKGSKKMELFEKRFRENTRFEAGVKFSNISFIHAENIKQLIDKVEKEILSRL